MSFPSTFLGETLKRSGKPFLVLQLPPSQTNPPEIPGNVRFMCCSSAGGMALESPKKVPNCEMFSIGELENGAWREETARLLSSSSGGRRESTCGVGSPAKIRGVILEECISHNA